MVLNFLHFQIKIERKQESAEQRIAKVQQENYLEKRAEAYALEAAQWNARI